jgi:hypothetical protein
MIKWFKGVFLSLFIRISLALKAVEDEFKAKVADLIGGGKEYKQRNNNPLLKKFEQGQTDEKYVQDYYEVLKKADEFVRSTNPDKAAKTADKHGVAIGQKDKWGMRWDHHGFLDPKHKHYGKTLKEIRALEIEERKMSDEDNYPIVALFNNKAELSFLQTTTVIKSEEDKIGLGDLSKLASTKKFPLIVYRKDTTVVNKIEQLVEFVHVKGISSKHFIIEMFIPYKYGMRKFDEASDVFKELSTFEQVLFTDEYGDKHAYRITSFRSRKTHLPYVDSVDNVSKYRFDVLKYNAEIMEMINM